VNTLKSIIAELLMPLPITLILLALGILLLLLPRRRSGIALCAGGFVLLFLAAWPPTANRLLLPLEQSYPAITSSQGLHGIYAIVVLGSAYYPEDRQGIFSELSETATVRLAEGVRLFHLTGQPRLILSGGSRSDGKPVSEGYRQGAKALGVPGEMIFELDTPRDTAQEAIATQALLGEGARVVLVTSASHMPRAIRHFEKVGLKPVAAPTHHLANKPSSKHWQYWLPSADALKMSERALYEYMGRVSFFLDH